MNTVANFSSSMKGRDVRGTITKKDETFYLQSGKILLYYGDSDNLSGAKDLVLEPGDKFHIYRGLRHQMVAIEDSELFEFSTEHFDEDSYRVAKGRLIMIGMNALGQNGRLGNQMFQYAALVGIAKNLGYDHCIPDHSKVTWFDRMEGDQIITQHHQLQHLFEMNHLNGRFGEATEYNINLSQAEFCKELYEECPDGATLYGYFESYHYFKDAEEEVRSDFTFRKHILDAKTFIRESVMLSV